MAVARGEVRQEFRRLKEAVEDTIQQSPTALAQVRSVLVNALDAVRAIRPADQTGAYVLPVTPELSRTYFPVSESPQRKVTPVEMAQADDQQGKALERGRRHRDEALAQLGPVLTPKQVSERLGVSTVTVNNWRRRGKLLAVRFDDHQYLYPTFQFAESIEQGEQGILRHLPEMLDLVPPSSPYMKARFFLSEAPLLHGRTPLELLRSGKPSDVERVRQLAPRFGEMGS